MTNHKVATRQEWQAARDELLTQEKELTRRGDRLAAARRALPWVPIEKDYRFGTAEGPKTLRELFDGRSQLIVYHFMFGPDYTAGCPACSSGADSFNGAVPHLNARDGASRGPPPTAATTTSTSKPPARRRRPASSWPAAFPRQPPGSRRTAGPCRRHTCQRRRG